VLFLKSTIKSLPVQYMTKDVLDETGPLFCIGEVDCKVYKKWKIIGFKPKGEVEFKDEEMNA
jgi:hypothetical protein